MSLLDDALARYVGAELRAVTTANSSAWDGLTPPEIDLWSYREDCSCR